MGLLSQNSQERSCLDKIVERSSLVDFEIFGKEVIQKGDTFNYDFSSIKLTDTNPISTLILKSGLLYPRLILSASTDGKYKFRNVDKSVVALLRISNLSELKLANLEPGAKVFTFLLWHDGVDNPSQYLLRLTNKKSNPTPDMETFIKGASLTAFGFCTVQI